MESDDAVETEILPQALPVSKIPENFNINYAPVTGEEYLSRVRLEASKSKVVVASIDTKKFEKNRTSQFFQSDFEGERRPEFKANREWQLEKCAEFSHLRDRVRKERTQFIKKYSINETKSTLKSLKSKREWYAFCHGKKSNNEEQQIKEPFLTILYSMDQNSVVKLFDYHVEWLKAYGYSPNKFKWMFSLMCFLEKPLIPETHSSLRDLARECIKIRSQLNDLNDEKLTELNFFIAIIGRYFEQRDLADEESC